MDYNNWQLWIEGHEGGEWELPPVPVVRESVQQAFQQVAPVVQKSSLPNIVFIVGVVAVIGVMMLLVARKRRKMSEFERLCLERRRLSVRDRRYC